jgi:hypothetical protein
MSKKKVIIEKYPFNIKIECSIKQIIDEHFHLFNKENNSEMEIIVNKKNFNANNKKSNVKNIFLSEEEKKNKKSISFLDIKKNKVKLWPIMADINGLGILPFMTDKPCRNCHHTFNNRPIGCPIKYLPDIKDDKDPLKKQIEDFFKAHNYEYDSTYGFGTDQLFCTPSCIKSYIFERLSIEPMSMKYNNSLSYLTLLVKKMYNIEGIPEKIRCADPIESLGAYGGHVEIDEYRDKNKKRYHEMTINVKRPVMFCCTQYIEEIPL